MRFSVNIPCFGDFAEAGGTWWDERQLQRGPDIDSLTAVLRRVEAGPPSL